MKIPDNSTKHNSLHNTCESNNTLTKRSINIGYLAYFLCLFATGYYFLPLLIPNSHLSDKHYLELCSRILSSLHIFIATTSAMLYLSNWINTTTLEKGLACSMAYLLADTTTTLLRESTNIFVIHHLLFLILLIFAQTPDLQLIARGLLGEIPIIPLNYCWYLIHIGKQNSTTFTIHAFLTIALYLAFRIYNFSYLLYILIAKKRIASILFFLPLVCMSYYWFYMLIYKAAEQGLL